MTDEFNRKVYCRVSPLRVGTPTYFVAFPQQAVGFRLPVNLTQRLLANLLSISR